MQTVAIQNLHPRRIEEYLRAIQYNGNFDLCNDVYNYVLVVRAKYLQISVAYYLYKNNSNRITNEFETFNRQYYELNSIFTEIIQNVLSDTYSDILGCKKKKSGRPIIVKNVERVLPSG